MSWIKWKMGLLVALISGALTGAIGLAVGMNREQILILLLVNVAKDGLLYLKDHPIDSVDTTTFINPNKPTPPPTP